MINEAIASLMFRGGIGDDKKKKKLYASPIIAKLNFYPMILTFAIFAAGGIGSDSVVSPWTATSSV